MKRQLKSISELKVGNIVISKASGLSYVVAANYGDRATGMRTIDITNPIEWYLYTNTLPNQTEQLSQPAEQPDVSLK